MKRKTMGLAVALSAVVMVAILAVAAWWRFTGYQTVSIINIVNFQSQLQPFAEAGDDGLTQVEFGGAAYLAAAIAELKEKHPAALVTESGDWMMGSWWRLFHGEPEFTIAKLLGVEVGLVGNHEFNLGADHLKQALRANGSFPLLATNINLADQELAGLLAKTVILTTADGVNVGFFSLVPPRFISLTKAGAGVSIDPDPVEVARSTTRQLRDQGADVVVMMSHASLEEDLALADQIEDLALIITGDSHYGTEANIRWVPGPGGWTTGVATGADNGKSLSAFNLSLHRGRPLPNQSGVETVVVSKRLPPDPKVAEAVETYAGRLDDLMNQPIGSFAAPMDARKSVVRVGEAPLGDFLADSFRWRTGAQLAVLNAGGIRGDRIFPSGPVSVKTVQEILPFSNTLIIKEMTGREIQLMMDLSASALVGPDDEYVSADRINSGGFLHFSGLKVTMAVSSINPPALVDDSGRVNRAGGRVKQVLIQKGGGWTTLNDGETYTVAMPDFLAGGGDKYTFLAPLPARETQIIDADAMIDYLKSLPNSRLKPTDDRRLIIDGLMKTER